METGKPDKVGEVGEETLGPLILPRPKKKDTWLSSVGGLMLAVLFGGSYGAISRNLQSFFIRNYDWTTAEADFLADGAAFPLTLGLLLLFIRLISDFRQKPSLVLTINRGKEAYVPQNQTFKIGGKQKLPSFGFEPKILFAVVVIFLAVGALSAESWIDQVKLLALLFVVVFVPFYHLHTQFRPLLEVNDQRVLVKRKSIRWKEIQGVTVQHILDLEGNFNSVKLAFTGEEGRTLAKVNLSDRQLSRTKERELLEYFAKILGQQVLCNPLVTRSSKS